MPRIDGIHSSGLPIGIPVPFSGSILPPKVFLCDGSLKLISAAPQLFRVIGTTYGGDGITTFGVPDIRGRTPVGMDSMNSHGSTQGLANRVTNGQAQVLGGATGEENHLLSTNEMPSHTHTQNAHSHQSKINSASVFSAATGGTGANNVNNTNGNSTGGNQWLTDSVTPVIQNTGGGLVHNNMQPSFFQPYIIAYG